MLGRNKRSVPTVHEATTKIEIDKDHVTDVRKVPTRKKKDQRVSTIVSLYAVTAHIPQLDWYHVWNVLETVLPVSHPQEALKIARLVQQTHSLSNLQLPAKIDVDLNVVLEPTPLPG